MELLREVDACMASEQYMGADFYRELEKRLVEHACSLPYSRVISNLLQRFLLLESNGGSFRVFPEEQMRVVVRLRDIIGKPRRFEEVQILDYLRARLQNAGVKFSTEDLLRVCDFGGVALDAADWVEFHENMLEKCLELHNRRFGYWRCGGQLAPYLRLELAQGNEPSREVFNRKVEGEVTSDLCYVSLVAQANNAGPNLLSEIPCSLKRSPAAGCYETTREEFFPVAAVTPDEIIFCFKAAWYTSDNQLIPPEILHQRYEPRVRGVWLSQERDQSAVGTNKILSHKAGRR